MVCDRDQSLSLAIRAVWPGTRIYPCTYHLGENLKELVRKGDLWGTGLERLSHARTFTTPNRYAGLLDVIEALKDGGYDLDEEQVEGVGKIGD